MNILAEFPCSESEHMFRIRTHFTRDAIKDKIIFEFYFSEKQCSTVFSQSFLVFRAMICTIYQCAHTDKQV